MPDDLIQKYQLSPDPPPDVLAGKYGLTPDKVEEKPPKDYKKMFRDYVGQGFSDALPTLGGLTGTALTAEGGPLAIAGGGLGAAAGFAAKRGLQNIAPNLFGTPPQDTSTNPMIAPITNTGQDLIHGGEAEMVGQSLGAGVSGIGGAKDSLLNFLKNRFANVAAPETTAAINALKGTDYELPLTQGQATGNKTTQFIEGAFQGNLKKQAVQKQLEIARKQLGNLANGKILTEDGQVPEISGQDQQLFKNIDDLVSQKNALPDIGSLKSQARDLPPQSPLKRILKRQIDEVQAKGSGLDDQISNLRNIASEPKSEDILATIGNKAYPQANIGKQIAEGLGTETGGGHINPGAALDWMSKNPELINKLPSQVKTNLSYFLRVLDDTKPTGDGNFMSHLLQLRGAHIALNLAGGVGGLMLGHNTGHEIAGALAGGTIMVGLGDMAKMMVNNGAARSAIEALKTPIGSTTSKMLSNNILQALGKSGATIVIDNGTTKTPMKFNNTTGKFEPRDNY